jgi:hypothetical protein
MRHRQLVSRISACDIVTTGLKISAAATSFQRPPASAYAIINSNGWAYPKDLA